MTLKGSFTEQIEASQVREVDPSAPGKYNVKQLLRQRLLPDPNPVVVNVGHHSENSGCYRHEKRMHRGT